MLQTCARILTGGNFHGYYRPDQGKGEGQCQAHRPARGRGGPQREGGCRRSEGGHRQADPAGQPGEGEGRGRRGRRVPLRRGDHRSRHQRQGPRLRRHPVRDPQGQGHDRGEGRPAGEGSHVLRRDDAEEGRRGRTGLRRDPLHRRHAAPGAADHQGQARHEDRLLLLPDGVPHQAVR